MLLKSFPKILGWSALLIWFSFIYLFLQYDATRPTAPQPSVGRIFAQNNHGHITYLTEQEQDRLLSLEIGAFSLFLVAALMDHFQRNPRQIGEIHVIAGRAFEDFFEPSAWYAAAKSLRRRLTWARVRSAFAVLVGNKDVRLRSEHTISACRARLVGAVGFNTVGPVLGSVKGDKFHLYVVRRDFRNSFSPHFHGKLSVAPSGTVIEGKFRMHFFVKIFLTIWFTGLIAIGGNVAIMAVGSIVAGRPTANACFGLSFVAALLLFGVLLIYWGKVLGSDDESHILGFLQHSLDSRPLQRASA
jgi:hypothetical protein